MPPLEASYTHCHQVMRQAARNFYFGMRLLPEAKRRAMHALYAFMRYIDDLTDGPEAGDQRSEIRGRRLEVSDGPLAALERWRVLTHAAIAGDPACAHPLLPALADTVRRFGIPATILDEAIDGQIQDLRQSRYDTFAELYQYCYRVASTVGIAALYIWGFRDQRALQLAEQRGVAMQLTNILRDLKEDAARGRQYLPTEDFARFNVDPAHLDRGRYVEDLIHFEVARADSYYSSSAELESLIDNDARPTLAVMTSIYHGILRRIAARPHLVLIRRVGLSTFEKLGLVARHAWKVYRIGPR